MDTTPRRALPWYAPPMARSLGWYVPEQLILKITLLGSDPKIWRRVEVHSGLTLEDLHYVIQCVFDWDNAHLHQFIVTPEGKLTWKARNAAKYYTMPGQEIFIDEGRQFPADEQLVGRVFTPECKQILYEYDFGDSWEHLVKLEKRTPGGDPYHVPVCLAGENAAPRDDMGGIPGYYRFLEAFADENDEMHEDAVEWLGEDFDETRFDLDAVNKHLAHVFKPVPKKPRKPRKKSE
jgi:hypothetical protein